MSIVPPSIGPITLAIIEALAAGTDVAVGDVYAPPAAGDLYCFLTRTDLRWSGSLKNPKEQAHLTYQVQCVGWDSDGVEHLEWKAREVLDAPPAVTGWVFVRWVAPDGSPGVRLDRDVTPHRYFSTPQFRMIARPA